MTNVCTPASPREPAAQRPEQDDDRDGNDHRNRDGHCHRNNGRAFADAHVIDRRELRQYMTRADGPAVRRALAMVLCLVITGALVTGASHSMWLLPTMVLHGIILVHLFSLQHECAHMTAFRTRRYNHWAAWICGIVINLGPGFFQYEHTRHHSYTQHADHDPQHIPVPASLGAYLLYLSALPYWLAQFKDLIRHGLGVISVAEKQFLPQPARADTVREARIIIGIYLGIAVLSVLNGWTWPLTLWLIPLLLGEPFMRFIRMTEHVAMPETPDLTENTRTNHVIWPLQMLCWNMNFHAEHHFAPSVPFHALPALHRRIGSALPQTRGYVDAHRDIVKAVRARQSA